jgi:transcriptional regulator GlxA family with amidase domain
LFLVILSKTVLLIIVDCGDGQIRLGLNIGLWQSVSNDNHFWKAANMPEAISRRIVITAYDGISLLDPAGSLEAFRVASTFGGPSGRLGTYECSVVPVRGGPVKTAAGVALVTDSVRSLSRTQIDTLIVPGVFLVDDVTRDRDLVRWVRKKAPHAGGCARCAWAVSCFPQL